MCTVHTANLRLAYLSNTGSYLEMIIPLWNTSDSSSLINDLRFPYPFRTQNVTLSHGINLSVDEVILYYNIAFLNIKKHRRNIKFLYCHQEIKIVTYY